MPFHRALYAAGKVTRETILAAAAKVGIDAKAAEAAIAGGKYDAEIRSNIGLAQKLQASGTRSEEHTSELQSLMRISYAVFCLKKKKPPKTTHTETCSTDVHINHNQQTTKH